MPAFRINVTIRALGSIWTHAHVSCVLPKVNKMVKSDLPALIV